MTGALTRWAHRRAERALVDTAPEKIERMAERAFVRTARHVLRHSSLYRHTLLAPGPVPRGFDGLMERLPIVDKSIFSRFDIDQLIAPDRWLDVEQFYSSSGSSGTFSLGAETRGAGVRMAREFGFMLDMLFDTNRRATLIVNCLPMGIQVATVDIPVVNCGVREDAVRYLVQRLHGRYEQFLFIGEFLLLKHIFEKLSSEFPEFARKPVHVVTGGEYLPESARDYIGRLLGHDRAAPEKGAMYFSMGASELGLSLMFESAQTVKLKRHWAADAAALRRLFSDLPMPGCPHVFQYLPFRNFLETSDAEELVVSPLDRRRPIPLLRYNTKDLARLVSYRSMERRLSRSGESALLSAHKLPYCLFFGKAYDPGRLSPNDVKQLLYSDFALAASVTGVFRLSPGLLEVQEAEGKTASPRSRAALEAALRAHPTDGTMQVRYFGFAEYPHHRTLNFELKVKYLDPVSR